MIAKGVSVVRELVRRLFQKSAEMNWALADQAMVSAVNFLTGIIVARYLGVADYGRFVLAWMAVVFFASLQQSGVIAPMMSAGPRRAASEQAEFYGSIVFHHVAWCLLSIGLLLAAFELASDLWLDVSLGSLRAPLTCAMVAYLTQDFIRRYLFVTRNGRLAFLNDAISYLGQAIILMGLSRYFNLDTATVLWVIALTSFMAVSVAAVHLSNLKFSIRAACSLARANWKFAKWLTGAALVQWASSNLLIIALGTAVGPAAVGALRAAQNVMGVTHILFLGLENVIPSGAAKAYCRNGSSGLSRYILHSLAACGGLTFVFCIAVAANPGVLLSWVFGAEFEQYGYILLWYIPVYLAVSVGLPIRSGLRALNETKSIFLSNSIAAFMALVSADYLIEAYGITGVMIGLLAIQLTIQIITAAALRRLLRKC